jgi:tight adherence protein B
MPRVVAALAAVGGLLFTAVPAALAGSAAKAPLTGWLATGTTPPNQALVLSAPSGPKLTTSNVHVTENGARVASLSVTPTSQAGPGDFGVVMLVDQSSSLSGAPLNAEMGAVRSFAAQRSGHQQLGLITFDGTPTALLPMTSNAAAISSTLSKAPWTGSGANVPAAIKLGLAQLAKAKVAQGAIIVLSDGVGNLTSSGGPSPATVQTAAAAAHVPIITVGVQDAKATAASLKALSQASPGQFVQASTSNLAGVIGQVYTTLTRGYVARWHSTAKPGQTVNVVASATGASGNVTASYSTPGAPAVRTAATAATAKQPLLPATHHAVAGQTVNLATLGHLSSAPSWALQPPAPVPAVPAATQTFWGSSGSVLVVGGLCGLLFTLAIVFALYRPSRRGVRMRVGSFVPMEHPDGEDPLHPNAAKKSSGLERILERQKFWPAFVEDVEISRNSRTPVYLVKRAALIGLAVTLVVYVVSGSMLFAAVPLFGWPFALRWLIKRAARKQREKFRDALPGYLQDLASALRVGRSLVGGLVAVADGADEPMHGELERAITDESLGRPLDESLEAVALRMQAPDMDQVALIAALNKRSGSNVAEALDRVAEGARERADLRREIRALTAQAKMSSSVLTALPGLLLIGINLISPLYAHPLFHTTLGLVLLGVGACMVFAGWKVMKKISTVEA